MKDKSREFEGNQVVAVQYIHLQMTTKVGEDVM